MLSNIRFYVLLVSATLAGAIYFQTTSTIPDSDTQLVQLSQYYALTAITYLYLALLASPLSLLFPRLPYIVQYIKARRALGVSAFFFGLIHATIAFFFQLGGFAGLPFLSSKYLIAITLSSTALLIMFLMASTAFDFMIAKLTYRRWKNLHRLVYVAAIFLVVHALLLGSHFNDLSQLIPKIFLTAVAILLALEMNRLDSYLKGRLVWWPNLGLLFALALAGAIGAYIYLYARPETPAAVGIHSQHIQLAKQAQQAPILPGQQGDRTRRFTVNMVPLVNPQANQDVQLEFKVYDAASGNPVSFFSRIYEKIVHLIVVDQQLAYFDHIHPEQQDNGFVITTRFPHDGRYHLYLDFQPLGAIEQQMAFTVDIGKTDPAVSSTQAIDTNLTKNFGPYNISMQTNGPLIAAEMSLGGHNIDFTLNDAQTGQPVINLKPYLAAYGHLVMINQQTYEYLHVHPNQQTPPSPDANGGPTVSFMPLGLYGPIKAGTYRVFAQFNPDNKLIVTDYTVKVQ